MIRKSDAHRPPAAVTMRIASSLLLVIGVSALAYPVVCNAFARVHQENAMAMHRRAIESMSDERIEKAWEDAERYNRGLALDAGEVETDCSPEEYETLLDPTGTGAMAVLSIDAIDLELPVYHGTDEEALRKGAGHLESSALPIGGEGYRPIIAGHRGLPEAELFTRLNELSLGDEFAIEVLGTRLAYRICEIDTVSPEEADCIEAEPGRDLVTLVTCTPYGTNTHRLLITGERIAEEAKVYAPSEQGLRAVKSPAIAIILLSILILILERKRCHEKVTLSLRASHESMDEQRSTHPQYAANRLGRDARRIPSCAKRFGTCLADIRMPSDEGCREQH